MFIMIGKKLTRFSQAVSVMRFKVIIRAIPAGRVLRSCGCTASSHAYRASAENVLLPK